MVRKKKTRKKKEEEQEEFFNKLGEESVETATKEGEEPTAAQSSLASLKDQPEWIDQEEEEGQLAVDVYEEGDNIVIKSTIAGVEPDDIDVTLVNDMLTIRGKRKEDTSRHSRNYFFRECYWGAFSRSIILPVEVDPDNIDATIKNGILTVTLSKLHNKDTKGIKVRDENE